MLFWGYDKTLPYYEVADFLMHNRLFFLQKFFIYKKRMNFIEIEPPRKDFTILGRHKYVEELKKPTGLTGNAEMDAMLLKDQEWENELLCEAVKELHYWKDLLLEFTKINGVVGIKLFDERICEDNGVVEVLAAELTTDHLLRLEMNQTILVFSQDNSQ